MIRFLTPLLIIGLALVSFFYFTTPVLKEIDVLKVSRLKLAAALENANRLKDRQTELLDLENFMDQNDLNNLKQFLPNNIDNVRLIIDINNIAKKRGLIVKNPTIANDTAASAGANAPAGQTGTGGAKSPSDKTSVVFSFSVSASYDIFKLFLDDLTHSLRMVDIESVSFVGNDKNFYDYKISLRTYWLK